MSQAERSTPGDVGYPAGPGGLPFLGNTLSFLKARNPAAYLSDLRASWGDVFTIWFGSAPTVFITGEDTMKEAFLDKGAFLNERPQRPNIIEDLQTERGMINDCPGRWLPVKQHAAPFFHSNASFGKKIDEVVSEELNWFMNVLESKVQTPIDTKTILLEMCLNFVTQMLLDVRLPYGCKQMENIRFTDYVLLWRKAQVLPFIKYLPFDPLGYHAAKKRFEDGITWLREQVAGQRTTFRSGTVRHYVDSFFEQIDAHKGAANTPFNEGNLISTLMNFYVGGALTPAAAIDFGLLYLLLNQDVQRKVQKEIDDIIGSGKPKYSNRENMPYIQAVIMETLRLSSVAIVSLDHLAVEDVVIKGKTIPKGTKVISNIWGTHNDGEFFADPSKFKPERFLNESNQLCPDIKGFVPFGVGARKCLGYEFAQCQMFLIFSTILQKYNISPAKGELPSNEGKFEVVLVAAPYNTVFTRRD